MKNTELLDINTNAEALIKENSSNNIKTEHIENTPFTIAEQNGEYFGLIANHVITRKYTSKETLKEEIQEINWDRIVQVIWAVVEKTNNIKETLKNT